MSEILQPASSTFASAALRVQRRLVLRNALRNLRRAAPHAAAFAGVMLVLRLCGVSFAGGLLALIALALVVIAGAVHAWVGRPALFSSLAFWDRAAGRSDDFANAWWFEQQSSRTLDQQRHLDVQTELLAAALQNLHREIVLPDVRLLAMPALLTFALLLMGREKADALRDMPLTDEAKAAAKQEAHRIADAKIDAAKMKALDEQEKKEFEALKQKVLETAKALEQNPGSTREVLGSIERAAREAERLAGKLGGDQAWASEAMIAEMRRHADTAELGDAAASRAAELTAAKAQTLADILRDAKLPNEVRQRLADAMRDVGHQAQPEDKSRTVGEHIISAEKNLAQSLPKEAGADFQALADKMRSLAAREKAREQLEKLAQQLREAGGNIAGQQGGMQPLAGNQGQQNQQGAGGQPQMMTLPNAQQMAPLQQPGFSSETHNAQTQGGSAQGSQQLMTMTPAQEGKPGQGEGKPGDGKDEKPSLFAPVPGAKPDGPPDAAIIAAAPGSSNGLQPGNATAKMDNKPTESKKATQTSSVNAARNADGASSVRTIEGAAHKEQAARSAEAATLDAIKAEENALDDASLPPARREQVRRYFTELRKRFEKQD